MTTIAYRDGVMASDSSCWDGHIHLAGMRKIWRVGGGLVGLAGDVVAMLQFLKWLKAGADDDEWPGASAGRFHAIVVDPKGRIRLFEHSGPEFYEARESYCAIGIGTDVALGALYAGANARDAVRAAIKHTSGSKPPVRAYRLKTP